MTHEGRDIEKLDPVCTFDTGGRCHQSVFTCKTCDPSGTSYLCHYCAQKCHEDHDLLDLYPKRGVVCDCGTTTTERTILCHYSTKLQANNNTYTQNNKGLYCKCHGTYDGEQPMISCWICQEWYHNDCLGIKNPPDAKFICCQEFLTKVLPHNTESIKQVDNYYYLMNEQLCKCEDCLAMYKENKWEFVIGNDSILETEELEVTIDLDRADMGDMMIKLNKFSEALKRSAYDAAIESNDTVVGKSHVIRAIKKLKLSEDGHMQEIFDQMLDELEQEDFE